MAKQLNLDEMAECLRSMNHPAAAGFIASLEAIGTAMAHTIASTLNVCCGEATFEGTGFAGTCAPFSPVFAGQECPPPLDEYDTEEWDDEFPGHVTGRYPKAEG